MGRIHRFYRKPGTSQQLAEARVLKTPLPSTVADITFEYCFYLCIETDSGELNPEDKSKVIWILTETFEPDLVSEADPFLTIDTDNLKRHALIEVGPRLAFSTAWSSNCLSMFQACGVTSISRIERSRRYKITFSADTTAADTAATGTSAVAVSFTDADVNACCAALHDRMTECRYLQPLTSFDSRAVVEPVCTVPVLSEGKAALQRINQEKGLGFDDWDIDFYTAMFVEDIKRDPTDVECFDLGQSNSEHSRHWFFGGRMVIDGQPMPETLFQLVKNTLPPHNTNANDNSVIAFHDNSSAIQGCEVHALVPGNPVGPSPMKLTPLTMHPILTAETHNFPSGVAPFPGAETGTGGRLRDVMATGRGAHTLAGVSAYCVGNLRIPAHPLPWEDLHAAYPPNLADPLRIEIEASNGASDYGNKYGEPVVCGFTRSFGQRLPSGERYEFLKPIMFTAGVGLLDSRHAVKGQPEVGMIVCKIGGPAYRIGMGGGAASSRVSSGTSAELDLDFNAVQRGDAEMENRMNRVIRACIELGDDNPIVSIHDQGAGGNGNVLKEIVDPLGARLELRNLPLGDDTMSVLEIWGAEYQENNAFLIRPESLPLVKNLGMRENCPVSAVGSVTGDGRVVAVAADGSTPFDLPLSLVLGKMPQKTYHFRSVPPVLLPLRIPAPEAADSDRAHCSGGCNAATAPMLHEALSRVLRLLDVGSKRFLTNKVDRSVTGLVAQQQCVGPLHTPLADVAVLAQSYFSTTGIAVSVGEQPIKGLINNAAQARMTVCEALANLVFADISSLGDVKSSCNWMWAAKLEEEGSKLYSACIALTDALLELGVGIDGGKDSLSMAAKVDGETVKSPGEVTLTCYAPCRDITKTLTPDFKCPPLKPAVFPTAARVSSTAPPLAVEAASSPEEDEHGTPSSSSTTTGAEDEGPPSSHSRIVYVDLGGSMHRLGGSALATVFGQVGEDCPDITDLAMFKRCFSCVQELNRRGLLLAGHDRSDGGLIVTLMEMAFAGNCGFDVTLSEFRCTSFSTADYSAVPDYLPVLFSEELGFIFEVLPENVETVVQSFHDCGNHAADIGRVTPDKRIIVRLGEFEGAGVTVLDGSMTFWRDVWESTSFALERLQCNPDCVSQEQEGLAHRTGPPSIVTFNVDPVHMVTSDLQQQHQRTTAVHAADKATPATILRVPSSLPRVAVIRQEGSNGDREMLAAFHAAGLEAWDVNMRDLMGSSFSSSPVGAGAGAGVGGLTLDGFRGVVFCGGFSYADVNDSAKGWAAAIKFNPQLLAQFDHFRDRVDTFSLGVCNGCQLLALLDWVSFPSSTDTGAGAEAEVTVDPAHQPRFVHNTSGRFESRWSAVKVLPSPSKLLQGMEHSTLGVWVAHGEGRAFFPDSTHLAVLEEEQLAPLRYVDDINEVTETYPFNPNGSPAGVAALCSPDGRHLAMMPHPERCFLSWQLPVPITAHVDYCPAAVGADTDAAAAVGAGASVSSSPVTAPTPAPWLRMFQNARRFCTEPANV